jgi:hypothetical protein
MGVTKFGVVLGLWLLLSGLGHAGQMIVKLNNIPDNFVVPLNKGTNQLLTAEIIGEHDISQVWMAATADADVKVSLTPSNIHEYQINLADAEVSDFLLSLPQQRFYIFASDGNTIGNSVPVVFARQPTSISVFLLDYEGQPKEISKYSENWVIPAEVSMIDVVMFPSPLTKPRVMAVLGNNEQPFLVGERQGVWSLKIGDDVQTSWKQEGELAIVMPDTHIRLRMMPERLLAESEEVTFQVLQRRSENIPGSDGFASVWLGDITNGQVWVRATTQSGQTLFESHTWRQGDTQEFDYQGIRYQLTLTSLVNLLVGDDYAEFKLAVGGG